MEGWRCGLVRTHNPTNIEVLPEERGVWAPQLGDLPWEDEPHSTWL